MILHRLCRARYARDLTGEGARLHGGRWNSKGVPALYAARSRALALVEVLAHLSQQEVPSDFVMVSINLPDALPWRRFTPAELPRRWRARPPGGDTQHFGDELLKSARYAMIELPSVVLPEEAICLINPEHPALRRMRIAAVKPFRFDERLFQ